MADFVGIHVVDPLLDLDIWSLSSRLCQNPTAVTVKEGTSMRPTATDNASAVRMPPTGERRNQAESAYQRIKEMLLRGQLPAGAQMLELEVAARLGMSRTPVREAMVRLEQEGMVELRPRHGMRVLPVSPSDMREIYEVLTALEGKAAELVASRGIQGRQLTSLRDAVRDMDAALEAGDLLAWVEADERFHSKLIEQSGNQRLVSMVSQLWNQAHRARIFTLRLRPKLSDSNREHEALVEAIARGDPKEARRLHEVHRQRAGAVLVDVLEQLGLEQV